MKTSFNIEQKSTWRPQPPQLHHPTNNHCFRRGPDPCRGSSRRGTDCGLWFWCDSPPFPSPYVCCSPSASIHSIRPRLFPPSGRAKPGPNVPHHVTYGAVVGWCDVLVELEAVRWLCAVMVVRVVPIFGWLLSASRSVCTIQTLQALPVKHVTVLQVSRVYVWATHGVCGCLRRGLFAVIKRRSPHASGMVLWFICWFSRSVKSSNGCISWPKVHRVVVVCCMGCGEG